ncbi:helix-turn-helix domain-containing protein [Cohnella nanjingensis]|uniref:Helix-turn-helix domain-containing protein n=1 Tax=Cohnella nanjingensis TaxID=1387779 RepID=A0A7X0VG99_9BACL|nr:helix-turn-helix domain-containing protein [Cohnella nanjingensis]MBB6672910.1 helix-turn-helix domain-containing protein [Cohnella nanjingensis]
METKSGSYHAEPTGRVLAWVEASGQGDKEATEKIIAYFREDIERLSRYMRMPREEAVQTLTLELIELVREVRTRRPRAGCAEGTVPYAGGKSVAAKKSG